MKRGKTEKWEEEEQDEEQVPLKISDSHTVYGSGAGAPPIAAAEEEEVRYAKWASVRKRVLALVALPALLPPITSTMYLPTINVVRCCYACCLSPPSLPSQPSTPLPGDH